MYKPFVYEEVEGGLGLEIRIESLEDRRQIQEFQQLVEEWFADGAMFFRFDLSRIQDIGDSGIKALEMASAFLLRGDAEVEFCGIQSREGSPRQ